MVSMERLKGTLLGLGLIGLVLWLKSAFSMANTFLGGVGLIGILVLTPPLIKHGWKKPKRKSV